MAPILYIVAATLFAFVVFAMHEYVALRYSRLNRAWNAALAVERKKNELIPALHKISTSSIQFEQSIILILKDAREALDQLSICKMDSKYLNDAEVKTKRLIAATKVSSQNFPPILHSKRFSDLMNEMDHFQKASIPVLADFNKAVEEFNRFIGIFPFSLINFLFNKYKPVAPYEEISPGSENMLRRIR